MDWRLRRWRLWFLALLTATRIFVSCGKSKMHNWWKYSAKIPLSYPFESWTDQFELCFKKCWIVLMNEHPRWSHFKKLISITIGFWYSFLKNGSKLNKCNRMRRELIYRTAVFPRSREFPEDATVKGNRLHEGRNRRWMGKQSSGSFRWEIRVHRPPNDDSHLHTV